MTRKHAIMSGKAGSAEKTVKDIRRTTRKHYGAEEKVRIVLEGLCGESSLTGTNPVIFLTMECSVNRGSDSVNGDNINQGSCI